MSANAREAYLTTQVMTATPQKLQLMLIDAAIRSGQIGRRHWEEGKEDEAAAALTHCQEVISELLASVGSAKSEISRRLAGIYLFLFRTLTEAQVRQDLAKLDDVLRVLAIERDTWNQVCEKYGSTLAADQNPSAPVELKAAATEQASSKSEVTAAAEPARVEASAPTGFDSSRVTPAAPVRRAPPIAFPSSEVPTGGISFEA